jgi:hypothetical protein
MMPLTGGYRHVCIWAYRQIFLILLYVEKFAFVHKCYRRVLENAWRVKTGRLEQKCVSSTKYTRVGGAGDQGLEVLENA